MSDAELLTVRQAAELLGNTVQHVRLLARTGQLKASKVGRDWIMDRDAVMDLKTKRGTTPHIVLHKRDRRPEAFVNESRDIYLSKGIIPNLEEIDLTHQI